MARVPRGAEPGRGAVHGRGHRRRQPRALQGHAAVALDEDDQHVLARGARKGGSPGDGRERVTRREAFELRPVGDPLLQVPDVLDGDGGRLDGGDPKLRSDGRPDEGEHDPERAEHRHQNGRGATMSRGDPSDSDRGDGQEHQDGQGGEADPDRDDDRPDAADAVPQHAVRRPEVRRVGQRVDAVEADQHADVEPGEEHDQRRGQAHDHGDDGAHSRGSTRARATRSRSSRGTRQGRRG